MSSLHSFEAIRSNLDGAAISTYGVLMVVLPLKLWCRASKGWRGLGWDDGLSIVALLTANAFFYCCMIGLRPDTGKHYHTEVTLTELGVWEKAMFVAQLLYTCGIVANKAAMLAFYWRLFSIKSRIPILALSFVVMAWFFAIFFSVVFTCSPVKAQWDLTITDKTCISTRSIWLGGSVPNVLTDVTLLILPIPYVWKLNAPMAQRIVLLGMFMLGCFVSVVSIVRLCILMNLDLTSSDVTFNFSEVIIWSIVEVNCGLICACLPSLRPAITLLGLDRILGMSTRGGLEPSEQDIKPSSASDSGALRPYNRRQMSTKKGRGFFTSVTETKDTYMGEEEEEDSYEMMKRTQDGFGQTTTNIEPARGSVSEERSERAVQYTGTIAVKRDWIVEQEAIYAP